MARFNKIYLGPVVSPLPQAREALASAALTPGTLAVLVAGAFANAGVSTEGKVWIVQDNYLQLKGVDDKWADGDTAICLELQDGFIYAGRLAAGENATAIGTPLKLAADGELEVGVAGTDRIVAFTDEAYDNTTGSSAVLVKIRASGIPGAKGAQGEQGLPGN